jgi:hypothetical protein
MSDNEETPQQSGAESDSSIGTDELNDLQSSINQTFMEVEESQNLKILKKNKDVPKNIDIVKKRGRPPKPIEEKLAKQVIKKEKIVYIIQDSNGNLTKKDPSKLGLRELQKIQREDDAQKAELEYGKKLARLKSGKAKIPKQRTEAQRSATAKMLEANRLRRAGKKSTEKIERKEEIKEVVKESVKEVVQEPAIPIPKPEKSVEQQYIDFFG